MCMCVCIYNIQQQYIDRSIYDTYIDYRYHYCDECENDVILCLGHAVVVQMP